MSSEYLTLVSIQKGVIPVPRHWDGFVASHFMRW
ncbi:MAG: splicing factor 3B subunit 2 [Wolbachia endosymbiont of Nomada fabriciana]|nr:MULTISPECIES: splicing factor 3B subunit 2 [unclassified Wolbachia]MDX5496674.1 splicing factor 3B subunit 2 [Wolbachia endosymbiont of Nomada fabriciana]MDX5528195.1 splicing factor 3B subunit 2 [Wolbachia endosymbiont of Andrena minutula]